MDRSKVSIGTIHTMSMGTFHTAADNARHERKMYEIACHFPDAPSAHEALATAERIQISGGKSGLARVSDRVARPFRSRGEIPALKTRWRNAVSRYTTSRALEANNRFPPFARAQTHSAHGGHLASSAEGLLLMLTPPQKPHSASYGSFAYSNREQEATSPNF